MISVVKKDIMCFDYDLKAIKISEHFACIIFDEVYIIPFNIVCSVPVS